MLKFAQIFFALILSLSISIAYAQSYGAKLCKTDTAFSCYTVKSGERWETLFPDATQRDVVMRVNRMNIKLHAHMTIAVPKNMSVDKMSVAPFEKQINPPGSKLILVSLEQLAWGAYDERGVLQNWGPMSGGRGYCADLGTGCHTPKGQFTIYNKGGAGCVSSKFPIGVGGAPMPYCMYFHGGFALHGSYDVPGHHASHGCVRMYVDDANWLNKVFIHDEKVTVLIQ